MVEIRCPKFQIRQPMADVGYPGVRHYSADLRRADTDIGPRSPANFSDRGTGRERRRAVLHLRRRGQEPEQRQGEEQHEGAGGAGLRTVGAAGESRRAMCGSGNQRSEFVQSADGKAEDGTLKEIPAEVKTKGKPERAAEDAGEGADDADGEGVAESPAQQALGVGIPEVEGPEERGENDDGPEGSQGFGEFLEGIAAEGQLLEQGSAKQKHGDGGGAHQHVEGEVEMKMERAEADDDGDIGGDEQRSESQAGDELAGCGAVQRQAESHGQWEGIEIKHAQEKSEAGGGQEAGDEAEKHSGDEIVLGKNCVDETTAPEHRGGPDGGDHEAHERRQQGG